MKHEKNSTIRSIMQTGRLTIELNSSADPSKSTPHGDEGRFWGDVVEKSLLDEIVISRNHVSPE
jgi:hypothetical protein